MRSALLTLDTRSIDDIIALVGATAGNVERANRSALGSTGYELLKLLRRSRRALAALNPHTPVLTLAMKRAHAPRERNAGGWVYKYEGRGKKRRRLKHFQRVGSVRHGTGAADQDNLPPFRKAVNALRYQVEGKNAVRVGFYRGASKSIDFTIAELIARQAEATDFAVTPRMRKFLFAAGMPVRAGTHLRRPSRNWLEQTMEQSQEHLQDYWRAKFEDALDRYRTGRAKT